MDSPDSHLTLVIEPAGRRLRAVAQRCESTVCLHVGGYVDASNIADWRHLLVQAGRAAQSPGPLVVDISGLEFLACCGFVALAEESVRCRDRGVRLCVIDDRRITARVVAAARLQDELPLYPGVEAALGVDVSEPRGVRHRSDGPPSGGPAEKEGKKSK